jgi:cytochrome b
VLLGGVVASLLLVVGSGIALHQTKSLKLVAEARTVPVPRIDFRAHEVSMNGKTNQSVMKSNDDDGEEEGWLGELHGFAANLMLLFVGLHVSYVILLRRPLAMFMMFVPGHKQRAT